MNCPFCGSERSRVVDTRDAHQGIRRRRECGECGQRYTTYERVTNNTLMVVKSDHRREPWDSSKVLSGVQIASAKRPIPAEELDRLVNRVEERVFGLGKAEITSEQVGQFVLEELKDLDGVAYLRFASVYLELADLEAMRAEIDRLLQRS